MHLDHMLIDLSLILVVASVVTLLMKKIKQPVVLGYIIAGFLISPNFDYLPTVIEKASITSWAEIGIVFLMFGLGLEFSFKKIATVGGSAFITTFTVMSAMIGIGYSVGSALGWQRMDCIFLGAMLSMSSTMIILKAYEEYQLKKEKFAQMVLGALVIEDIAGIFIIIILSTISVSQNISGLALATELGTLLLFLAVWLLVGIFLIPTILKKISGLLNDELLLIFSLAVCLGMVMIANLIGFSSALGAFMAGSILAGTVRSDRIEHLVKPIKDLFGAVFFVSVGMLIQPELLVKYIVPIIVISIATMFGQMIFSTIGMLLSGQSLKIAVRGGCSMVQIGEFSFIIATLGMNLGVIHDFLYPIVVCVSVITSFTTPIFIKNAEKVYGLVDKLLPKKLKNFLKKNTSESQIKDDKDTDWKIYLQRIFVRTFVCTVVMFCIYRIGINVLQPKMLEFLGEKGDIVTTVILLVMMVPFVSLMHGTNRVYYTKLWLKHRANRLPLLTFTFMRVFIADAFIAMVIHKIWSLPYIVVFVLAIIPVIMIVKSDYAKGMAKGLEIAFIANFYEKTLDSRKKELHAENERWLDETLQVVRFRIIEEVEEYTVKKISSHRHVHLGIIKVRRDDKIFNMPKGAFELKKGDEVHAMGTPHEIDATLLLFAGRKHVEVIPGSRKPLKYYIYTQTDRGIPQDRQLVCVPILIKEDSPFVRKSIKHSRIREKYNGSVFGIERDNLPITHPSVATILLPGDLIWMIGSVNMANRLLRDDLLDTN